MDPNLIIGRTPIRKWHTWNESVLSPFDRRILIQSVSSTLLAYWMGLHKVCEKFVLIMHQNQPRFLWVGKIHSRQWIPIAWDRVMIGSVPYGGLGIKSLDKLNSALLAKTLWVHLLRQKFLKKEDIQNCNVKGTESPFWKALLQHRLLIFDNQRWVIGNGTQFRSFRIDGF